jgi:hypothetical protein
MKALLMDENGKVVDPESGKEVITKKVEVSDSNKVDEVVKEKEEEIENKVDSPEKPKVYTIYEVGPESIFYVKFGIMPIDGRMIVIKEDDIDFEKNAESHWVKFKMWSYEQELEWKNESTEYDSVKRVHTLNADKLNEIKIRNLILKWSFGEKQDSLKLFHVNGLLTDESLKTFYSLYPAIVRYIVERMNDILEFNF